MKVFQTSCREWKVINLAASKKGAKNANSMLRLRKIY